MLSFSFKSLRFKNPLTHKKQFYMSIELAEGAPRTTETVSYLPRMNFAIFSETLEFSVKNPQENTYFHLEIYEENSHLSQKKQRIFRETIHLNKMSPASSKELLIPTTYGDAIIDLALDMSEEFDEIVLGKDKPLPKVQTKRREQAMTLENFNLIKLAPLMYEFVLALSPLMLLRTDIGNFFSWKNPHKTFFLSLLFSLFILYNQKLMAFGLLGFFVFNRKLIPILIQVKPIKDDVKGALNIYKRNLVLMRELMQFVVWVDETLNKLFNNPDKTLLLHIFLFVKKVSPFLSIACFLGDTTQMGLIGYWGLLLYQTDLGNKVIKILYKGLSECLDCVDLLLVPIDKIEGFLAEGDVKYKKAESILLDQPDQPDDSPKRNSSLIKVGGQKVLQQKTFVVYENQRWRLGRGWCTKLYGNDRPAWSDDLGKLELNKESFRLPGSNWVWETDWSYVVNSSTDALGWEYSDKFSTFHKNTQHKKIVNFVRRRKWVKRCAEVEGWC